LITMASNGARSAPDSARYEEAARGVELLISVDPYVNETTRQADIILPPTSPLERDHYDVFYEQLHSRNHTRYVEPVMAPPRRPVRRPLRRPAWWPDTRGTQTPPSRNRPGPIATPTARGAPDTVGPRRARTGAADRRPGQGSRRIR